MALLFMEGFDLYANGSADLLVTGHNWTRDGADAQLQFSATGGKYGGGAINCLNDSFSWIYTFPTTQAPGTTLIIQFHYYNNDDTDASEDRLLQLYDTSSNLLFRIQHVGNGNMTIDSNGANDHGGTHLAAIPPDQWNFVQAKIVLGTNATTGSIEVRINGNTYGPFTGIDTFTGLNCNRVFFGGLTNSFIDDIIIMDGTGARLNDFIDEHRITAHGVTGDGAVVDWTASAGSDASCVDEALIAHNGDTDYIASGTAAQESRFDMAGLPDTPTSIHAVQVRLNAKQQTAGDTYRGLMNSGGTEQVGATLTPPAAYAWNRNLIQMVDPATTASWTKTGVDALQVGAEVVTAGGGSTRISTAAMEVLRSVSAVTPGGGAKPITCVIAS